MRHDSDLLDTLASAVAAERAHIETELVASILSQPAKGVLTAQQAGIDCDLFDQDDLRAMFIAADYGRDQGVLGVLRFARFLLRHLGLWDEGDTRCFTRGMRWGNESLAAFAESYPGTSAVGHFAMRLRRIDACQREATDCYRRMVGLLDGTIEPGDAPAVSKRHNVVFAPMTGKGVLCA